MRHLAVYTDFAYREVGGQVTAELPFVVFVDALGDLTEELTILGRLAPGHEPLPHRVRADAHFVGLPFYASLAQPLSVLRALTATARRFASATRGADTVWLFGPHPFCLAFALIATVRGQRVALGVRQDLPALIARRRPGRRGLQLAARALEQSYRLMARRFRTLVVGPDLARLYRRAPRLLNLPISLVRRDEITDLGDALQRDYEVPRLKALSVGRLDAEKNPLLLADIALVLSRRDPRWHLDVCGDGPMRPELEARLAALGVADRVTLHGYVSLQEGLPRAYRSSHALLHVSWTEGVPQVLFEAFAAGLPVVATAVGGVPEAAGDGALLVPPGDAGAAADALHRVASDPELRERLVRTGNETVSEVTLERQVERAVAFLDAT